MNPNRSRTTQQPLAALRWLRRNQQHGVPVSLLALYLGVWLMAPRHKPQAVPAPLPPPVVAVAPAPPAVEPKVTYSDEQEVLLKTINLRVGRDKWKLEVWRSPADATGTYVIFYKNQTRIQTICSGVDYGTDELNIGRGTFPSPYPILVVQAEPGCTAPGDSHFYAIRRGRLKYLGKVEGLNGGPIFRDYDGDGKPEWVFNDYEKWDEYTKRPQNFLIFKQQPDGALKLWKKLPNPHRLYLHQPIHWYDLNK